MRPKGSPEVREAIRRLAVARVLEGYDVAEVAEFVGVAPFSVRRWVAAYERGGEEALAAVPAPGRPRRLGIAQERRVLSWVARDAREFGFLTPRWTAPRLAEAVEDIMGVRFSPRYLNAWLARRRVTPQVPARPAREQDPDEVERWLRYRWPRIKKTRRRLGRHSPSPTRAAF